MRTIVFGGLYWGPPIMEITKCQSSGFLTLLVPEICARHFFRVNISKKDTLFILRSQRILGEFWMPLERSLESNFA